MTTALLQFDCRLVLNFYSNYDVDKLSKLLGIVPYAVVKHAKRANTKPGESMLCEWVYVKDKICVSSANEALDVLFEKIKDNVPQMKEILAANDGRAKIYLKLSYQASQKPELVFSGENLSIIHQLNSEMHLQLKQL